jgi:hypothetical protein
MNAICQNCKGKLSCGCQKRVASNGVSVCTLCLSGYETKLKQNNIAKPVQPATAPTNVNIFYNRNKIG